MFRYPAKDAERLCSDQVINSLSSVVKELIDNSLDAGATFIEIKLKENGLESIEVTDNGCGIPDSSFEKLCARHYTSKISALSDLCNLSTLGFRGEALNSICNLSTGVHVSTKIEDAEIGTKIHYDQNGNILKKFIFPRTRGTTVTVLGLFANVPVRRKFTEQHIKSQVNQLINLISSYALARISIRFSLSNMINGITKQLFIIQPETSLANRVPHVLKNVKNFLNVTKAAILSEVADEFNINIEEPATKDFIEQLDVTGLVSSPGDGKTNGDAQFFSINSRPVDLPILSKILNQVYRSHDPLASTKAYPFFVLNLTIPCGKIDLNVTPDKRTILINGDKVVFALVKSSVINVYGADSVYLNRSEYSKSSSQTTVIFENERTLQEPTPSSQETPTSSQNQSFITNYLEPLPKRPISPGSIRRFSTESSARNIQEIQFRSSNPSDASTDDTMDVEDPVAKIVERNVQSARDTSSVEIDETAVTLNAECKRKETGPTGISPSEKRVRIADSNSPNLPTSKNGGESNVPRAGPSKDNFSWRREKPMKIDLVKARAGRRETSESEICHQLPDLDSEAEEQVITEVQKRLSQGDFVRMQIIGQFNRGFILCLLDGDLFVIDQHAADERCNFDHLLKHTALEGQKLIVPQNLRLNAYDEQIVLDNKELFIKNGFRFSVDESQPYGSRISLLSVPSVKHLILCQKDIEEMIQTIIDAPYTPRIIRPTRVKELLASKACRKSIMISDHLNYGQMVSLLKKLHVTESPWTCAHGRPTVRILGPFDFDSVGHKEFPLAE